LAETKNAGAGLALIPEYAADCRPGSKADVAIEQTADFATAGVRARFTHRLWFATAHLLTSGFRGGGLLLPNCDPCLILLLCPGAIPGLGEGGDLDLATFAGRVSFNRHPCAGRGSTHCADHQTNRDIQLTMQALPEGEQDGGEFRNARFVRRRPTRLRTTP
jgi:hypothetical protein